MLTAWLLHCVAIMICFILFVDEFNQYMKTYGIVLEKSVSDKISEQQRFVHSRFCGTSFVWEGGGHKICRMLRNGAAVSVHNDIICT